MYNRNTMKENDRRKAILEHLAGKKGHGGDSVAGLVASTPGIGSPPTVSKSLADMLTDGLVNRTKSSRNSYGGYSYYYHITPRGEMRLADSAPALKEDAGVGDWSVTPTLMPPRAEEGDAVAASVHTPVAVPESTPETAPETAPAPAPEGEDTDVESLVKALDSLRAISTGDSEIDRTVGLLAGAVADRVGRAVAPCPCCGAAMRMQSVGTNRALECTGCHLAVTYREDPTDLNALVKRWARRTP